jgi:hypothetical protein
MVGYLSTWSVNQITSTASPANNNNNPPARIKPAEKVRRL